MNHSKNFRQKYTFFCSMPSLKNYFFFEKKSDFIKKGWSFFPKKNSLKIFLLTSKMQFLQLSRNLCGRKVSDFLLNVRERSEVFFQVFHQFVFYRHVECCSDNSIRFFWQKVEKFSLNVQKWLIFFQERIFFKNFLLTSKMQFLQLSLKISEKNHNSFVQCRIW